MTENATKSRTAAMLWALPLLLLGALFSFGAWEYLQEWDALSAGLKVSYALMGLAAFGAVLCGLWLVASLGRHRWAQRIGGIALAGYAVVLVLGTVLTIIPCAGPG